MTLIEGPAALFDLFAWNQGRGSAVVRTCEPRPVVFIIRRDPLGWLAAEGPGKIFQLLPVVLLRYPLQLLAWESDLVGAVEERLAVAPC